MIWTELLNLPTYQMNKNDKKAFFDKELWNLSLHHYQDCSEYRDILDVIAPNIFNKVEAHIPPIHANVFKHHFLKSVPDQNVYKVTTSSGTSGQQVSKIALDKENIVRQQKILYKIISHWLGQKRLPMLIIDHPNVIKDKHSYSARGVGIQGLSLFGHHHTYALNDDLTLNLSVIEDFFTRYKNEKIFIFGFTFMVWQYFLQKLYDHQVSFQIDNAILLHSGGWKKLQEHAVSNEKFKKQVQVLLGNVNVHNFYGMVEQTGTVYVECEHGFFHCPIWNDIHIKHLQNMKSLGYGEKGVIQVNSLLPTSYPGHMILTEDVGTIIGEDNCQCGRLGKYFTVEGRIAQSQVRGCSDTQN